MALQGVRRRPSSVVVVPEEEEEEGDDDGRLSAGQFRGAFAADSFVSDLLLAAAPHIADARSLVDRNSNTAGNAEHTNGSSAALQFPGVPSLLAVLAQVTQELAELGTQVDKRIQGLERSVAAEEVAHANDLHELEEGMEKLLDSFSMLDEHVGQVSRTAARIGDRLQSQETQRLRAEEAQQLIEYLMEFNARPGDLRGISRVFRDNNSLTEAATLAKKLRAFAEQPPARSSAPLESVFAEASAPSSNANESTRAERLSSQSHTSTSGSGGLSVAVANLQQYCNDLENRLLDRFQDALQESDVDEMATCAETLVQFNGGHNVMQRFVATRPMFMDVQAMLGGKASSEAEGDGEARTNSGVAQAKAALEPLFSSILDEVKDAAEIAAQVFPSPPAVMAMLVQRVLEQRVQAALDQLLPDSTAPAADGLSMLEYLRLLQDAYSRTKQLATELTEIGCGELDVQGLADSLFSNHCEEYIENELACSKMLGAPQLASATGVVHFADYAIASVQQTKEAVTRCTKLVPQRATCATYIQRLFFVLLEQVGLQVLGSLKTAVEGVMAAIIAVERGGASGAGKRAAAAASAGSTAAATVAESSLRSLFAVISEASAAVPSVHEHYETIVASSVTAVPHSQAACSTELLAFLRVTEEQVTRGLQAALHLVIVQVDRALLAEQSASDFQPKDAAAMPDHRSTSACTKVLELLQSTQALARKALDEANRQSFFIGLGFKLHSVLLTHIERFMFNSSGGLRLKRDVSEYSAFVRSFNSPAVQERFERLSTLINVFIVAPESLRQLVDTTLGLTAQEALRYLKLREDFRSAKIANLFAGL